MRIWKYPLDIRKAIEIGFLDIEMSLGAKVLSIEMQFGQPVLWAQVDPNVARVTKRLLFFTTGGGDDIPDRARFVTTLLLMQDHFVLHVFEDEAR